MLCKVPCLYYTKASFISSKNNKPISPQPCHHPHAGLKCFYYTCLYKYYSPIPAPFKAKIMALQTNLPKDINIIATTTLWT
jgi:hypothetical protein